ncbi:MAG: MATE family efflux transporter, partial [Acidobacteriota bacterium]
LAVPLAAAQAGTQLMSLVDAAVVGRLGARQLGAVGIGNSLFFFLTIMAMGAVMGVDPMIAQAIGAGDPRRARQVMWQGVWLAFAVSVLISIPLALAPLILGPIGIDSGVASDATIFLLIRIAGVAPFLLFVVFRAYLQAQNITRPMIEAMVVANVANLLLDLLLVYGGSSLPEWTGPLRLVPALGIGGSAISTVTSSFIQLAVLVVAVRGTGGDYVFAGIRRVVREDIVTAFRVGLPLGLQMGAEIGIFALVGLLAGRLGRAELAAHQLAITLASFTFTGALGIGAAGSVRVGRAIGAGDQDGTRRAGLVAFGGGAALMSISALSFWLFPRPLAYLISNQPIVIATAIPLMAVAAFFQISDGVQAVGAGVLRGAADTRYAFVANLLGHWAIGLPVAVFLGFGLSLGIVGLWWGLCAGLTVVAALLFVRFLRLSSRLIEPV